MLSRLNDALAQCSLERNAQWPPATTPTPPPPLLVGGDDAVVALSHQSDPCWVVCNALLEVTGDSDDEQRRAFFVAWWQLPSAERDRSVVNALSNGIDASVTSRVTRHRSSRARNAILETVTALRNSANDVRRLGGGGNDGRASSTTSLVSRIEQWLGVLLCEPFQCALVTTRHTIEVRLFAQHAAWTACGTLDVRLARASMLEHVSQLARTTHEWAEPRARAPSDMLVRAALASEDIIVATNDVNVALNQSLDRMWLLQHALDALFAHVHHASIGAVVDAALCRLAHSERVRAHHTPMLRERLLEFAHGARAF